MLQVFQKRPQADQGSASTAAEGGGGEEAARRRSFDEQQKTGEISFELPDATCGVFSRGSSAAGTKTRTGANREREKAERDPTAGAEGEILECGAETGKGQFIHGCVWWQDEERREGELEELHHLLQENQEKAAQWKTNTAETIKVWRSAFSSPQTILN